jgi:Putative DNA-binding domain
LSLSRRTIAPRALGDKDKFQFSRALSGFANSDGGVLVFGIETDKQERARRLRPITAVAQFYAALKKSLLNTTQPVVDGVLIDVIRSNQEDEAGYVKILVPSSEKAPHRAMLAGREYYKRTTEGFYRLEHFDLEDMFGRRPHPVLNLHMELRAWPDPDPNEELHFGLQNVGRGLAKYCALLCRFGNDVRMGSGSGVVDQTAVNRGLPTVGYSDNLGVIHATGVVVVVGHAIIQRQAKRQPLRVNVSWFCEGMVMRSFEGEVASEGTA